MKKFNFKKITAIATSVLMVGMTMGAAAAANYPAPFVSGGAANVAVVYGTGAGVSQLDLVQSGNIQANLQSKMGASSTSGTSVSTSGETASLDKGSSTDHIWLNTSLDSVTSSFTKSSLPTVLADYTFEGDVSSTLTESIKILTGATTGTETSSDNLGTVIFTKPKSGEDPAIGLSMGTSQTVDPLYNATVTMTAINFTDPDSIGQELDLFGQKFTVSADTTLTSLVLLKQAQKLDLSIGTAGTSNPSAVVTISGKTYTIELTSADATTATVKVTDSTGASDTKTVSEAKSKKIQGVQIAVTSATAGSQGINNAQASIIAGADKVTLTGGQKVTYGDDNTQIKGTYAYIKGSSTAGTTNATTEITVTVFANKTAESFVPAGGSFVDPVFGSFKLDFPGLNYPLDDASRDIIHVNNSGDKAMTLEFTDTNGKTIDQVFVYNATFASTNAHNAQVQLPANWRLADDGNNSIYPFEGANLSEDEYTIVGNEDFGHLLQVSSLSNDSTTGHFTQDVADFEDIATSDIYHTAFTSEGVGTVDIDGKSYTVQLTGDGTYATLKYPTSESATVNTWVVYPTIQTKNGAKVALYEPLNASLAAWNGTTATAATILQLPKGDGTYGSLTFTYAAYDGSGNNWTVTDGTTAKRISPNATVGLNYTAYTIGRLTYNVSSSGYNNNTVIHLVNPETTTADIKEPAVVVLEGKDKNSHYNAVVIDLVNAPAGTSTNAAEVNDVFFTSTYYHGSSTLASDSDITKDVDWFGTLVTTDSTDSNHKTVTVSYPKDQVYAKLYLGAAGSEVSSSGGTSGGSTQLGNVLVKDSEVSSVNTKNLIVVGGSCINSAAAALVGGAKCGPDWTSATGVGTGEFLIKGYASSSLTSGTALLVAGYEAADTVNAATYLTTQTVDTSKAYKGTTSTSATLVNSTA